MNNLEAVVPFMKQLEELLTTKKDHLNVGLSKVGVRGVDIESPIMRIQEQVRSAEVKYTIAFVGTFKTGKSTIINSLLNLQGDARLSSEFDPDTAKCIRIMKKEHCQKYDAEVIFTDTYPAEWLSWQDAKKYTSQVALDNSSSTIVKKAEKIEEVRYYVDNPFLDVCNILDLPGTGTGAHSEHTDVTDRKIMESDCIFWVVSTDVEPDSESILNLEKFSTKMLPIINVWQSESEDIYSTLEPDYIKDMLLNQFGAYFASAEAPVYYYAREIDLAQQENRELKAEWGKENFTAKVEEILNNIQNGDRMKRIKKNIGIALSTCEETLKNVLEDQQLVALAQNEKTEKSEITQIFAKLDKEKSLATDDIRSHAKKVAEEITEVFTDASDAFIENTMYGTNWKALINKRKFQDDLKRDFEKNYVRIKSGWLDNMIKEYSDDVATILQGIYIDFSIDIESINDSSSKFTMEEDDLSSFIDAMAKIMADDMKTRITPTLIATIAGGIMMLIPGGIIFDVLATVVCGGIGALNGLTKDDKLRSKINGMKLSSKVQIRQQKSTIKTRLAEAGKNINDNFYSKIKEKLNVRKALNEERDANLRELKNEINDILSFITEQTEELSRI